jgi:nitrogen regulatory protein PII
MKSVFIVYNQALSEKVDEIIDHLKIRGYTLWTDVKGRGTNKGEPHMGTHTWPALNSAIMTIIEDKNVEPLLIKIEELNKIAEEQGVRAFVWDIEKSI